MSVDKLVDSTQLDAALTYEAGRIRAKLGSGLQLDFDLTGGKGFGDYIESIPGGGHARQAFYLKFYPTSVLTDKNKMTVQLEASSNCYILVRATSFPAAPASGYKALVWGCNVAFFTSSNVLMDIAHRILRANGTIGTDSTQCSYARATGVLSIGGSYGYFNPEDEYEIIQIVFE